MALSPISSEKHGDFRLSICIPTFNRYHQVKELVSKALEIDPSIEICVHVDGSSDETLQELKALENIYHNVKCTYSSNQGRAHALLSAIMTASAPFIMLYDDDDDIFPDRVRSVLPLLDELPEDVCGLICHMADETGNRLGTAFPVARSNFLKLRFDQKVRGDKKEITKSDLLRSVLYKVPPNVRRAPTSLLWNRLALTHDVVCTDTVLGTKRYLSDGYTRNIWRLKRTNPVPMRDVNRLRFQGYIKRRYNSVLPAMRSLAAWLFYSIHARIMKSGIK